MKIGDKLRLIPSERLSDDRIYTPLPCTVVYIHPERRFYTVEFKSEVTCGSFRESFPYPDRPEVIREQPQKDPADKQKAFGPASLRKGGIFTKAKG